MIPLDKIISIEDLWFRYSGAKDWALKGINLTIGQGEFVAIIGPNGAGKTTLCLSLNGIVPYFLTGELKGKIGICGMDTSKCTVPQIAQKVGLVFSDPESQLSQLTVEEEVMFGPANLGVPKEEIFKRAKEVMETMKLNGLEKRPPHTLSGGQKQRLAIASVLAMKPLVLVLDEPTTQLDPVGTLEVFQAIKDLKEQGITIVMVEHKMDLLAESADRIILLDDGKIILDGAPSEVFGNFDVIVSHGVWFPEVTEIFYILKQRGLYNGINPPVRLHDACLEFEKNGW